MVPPFGFSVGDFIAVGVLIKDVIVCLQSSSGSAADYRELMRELEGLAHALHEIEHLRGSPQQEVAISAIKCAALNCNYVLHEFLQKVKKYEKSLGDSVESKKLKAAGRKIQWKLDMEEDVLKLRAYLNAHVGSLNMRMLAEGL